MPKKHSKTRSYFSKSKAGPLDAVNHLLLQQLGADPRMSMSELARRVRMSSPAVTERVQRLKDDGVIAGFRMDVDPRALGLPVAAYVRIRPMPGQHAKLAELAQRTPAVVECHRITGEDCFLLKLHVADMAALEKQIDRFLIHGQTTTSIVQSSPVPLRPLPLPSA